MSLLMPQLGASKEPQHRRLQEEEPAGDEEPAPSEERPAENEALPDAQGDWVEPDLGIAGTAGWRHLFTPVTWAGALKADLLWAILPQGLCLFCG